jgi:hypothetical protein
MTILAKQAFEKIAAEHGIRIEHYHYNNGQFADNAFKQACKANRQQLAFYGVNVHFPNRIAKQVICNLLESIRKQLLHACAWCCWLAAVHFCLVAIHPVQCHPSPQQFAGAGGWHIEA